MKTSATHIARTLGSTIIAAVIGFTATGCLAPVDVDDEQAELGAEASEPASSEDEEGEEASAAPDETSESADVEQDLILPPLPAAAPDEGENTDETPDPSIVDCLALPETGDTACEAPRSDCIGDYVLRSGNILACVYHAAPTECAIAVALEYPDVDYCDTWMFFGDHYPFAETMETYLGYRFDEGAERGYWACAFQLARHQGDSSICEELPIDFSGGQACEEHIAEFAASIDPDAEPLRRGSCL